MARYTTLLKSLAMNSNKRQIEATSPVAPAGGISALTWQPTNYRYVATNAAGGTVNGTSAQIFGEQLILSGSSGGGLKLYEGTSNGVHSLTVKAPDAVTADKTLTLPDGPPATSGYALVSTDVGVMSWAEFSGANFYADALTYVAGTTQQLTIGMQGTSDIVMTGDLRDFGQSIKLSGTNAGSIDLHEAGGSELVRIQAPATVTGVGQIYTLPDAYPASNGYALVSSTAGAMSWAPNSSANYYVTGGTYDAGNDEIDFTGVTGFPAFSVDTSAFAKGSLAGAANYVGYFTATNALTGTAGFQYDGTNISSVDADFTMSSATTLKPELTLTSTSGVNATNQGGYISFYRNDSTNPYTSTADVLGTIQFQNRNLASVKQSWADIKVIADDVTANNEISSIRFRTRKPATTTLQDTMTIYRDRVGIKTNTPAYQLDVVGTTQLSGNSSIVGTLTTTGVATLGNNSVTNTQTAGNNTTRIATTAFVAAAVAANSGTPAGSSTQLQYNNGGAFGGVDDWTWNGTDMTIATGSKLIFGDANRYIDEDGANLRIRNSETGGNIDLNAKNLFRFYIDGAQKMSLSSAGTLTVSGNTTLQNPLIIETGSATKFNFKPDDQAEELLITGTKKTTAATEYAYYPRIVLDSDEDADALSQPGYPSVFFTKFGPTSIANPAGDPVGWRIAASGSAGIASAPQSLVWDYSSNQSTYSNKLILSEAGVLTATTFSGELAGTIASTTTATTQSSGDNSTKVATTAYADAAAGGGGGTPGGSTTQIQYNDAGAFAGSANFTFNGTNQINLVPSNAEAKLQLGAGNVVLQYSGSKGRLYSANRTLRMGNTGAEIKMLNGTSDSIHFFTNGTSDSGTERMTILSGGNVGIGTTAPNEKLEVAPNTDVNAIIGRAVIGYTFSDYASFTHYDKRADTGGYALLQNDTGGTYLNAAASKPIYFRINNSDKMRLTSDGNLGIGTTAPAGKLEVIGSNGTVTQTPDGDAEELVIRNNHRAGISILSSDSASRGGYIIFGGATDANAANIHHDFSSKTFSFQGQNPDMQLRFASANNVEAMRIDASQNVGIGTTSPSNALSVWKAINNDFVAELKNTHATAGQSWGLQVCAGTNSSDAALAVENEAEDTSLFYVRGDGNVGIGNNNPGYELTLGSAFMWDGNHFRANQTNGASMRNEVPSSTNPVFTFNNDTDTGMSRADNNKLSLITAGVEAIRIDASQNVGIGTTTPSNPLHIAGHVNPLRLQGTSTGKVELGVSTSGDFTIDSDDDIRLDAGGQDIALKGAGTEYGRLTNSSSDFVINNSVQDKDLIFKGNDGGSIIEAMRIDYSEGGIVGIGTTTPGKDLDVNGQFRCLSTGTIGHGGTNRTIFAHNNEVNFYSDDATTPAQVHYQYRGGEFNVSRSALHVETYTANSSNPRVGIGTSSPGAKLDVVSTSDNNTAGIRIGDGTNFCALYNDAGENFIIDPTNDFIVTGADDIKLQSNDDFELIGDDFVFVSGSTTMMRIAGAGSPTVGVSGAMTVEGTTTASGSMSLVNGAITSNPGANHLWASGATLFWGGSQIGTTTPGAGAIQGTATAGRVSYGDGSNSITSSANFTYNGTIVDINGNLRVQDSHTLAAGDNDDLFLYHDGNSTIRSDSGIFNINQNTASDMSINANGGDIVIDSNIYNKNDGKVGIGTSGPDAKVEILSTTEQLRLTHTDASEYATFTVDSAGGLAIANSNSTSITGTRHFDLGAGSGRDYRFNWAGNERVTFLENSSLARIGINQPAPAQALDVNGNVLVTGTLSATAKSFNIPHPLYKDKRLVHGSLEGPEHAIYIRGTIETEEKGCLVELPEYWSAMCEDYTVQLTPHGPYTVYIKEKLKDKVMIECSEENYKFDYYIVGARTDETIEVVQDG